MPLTNEDLKAIGQLLQPIRDDIVDMKTDIVDMKTDIVDMKTDIVDMKTDISGLKTDVGNMKTDISGLKTDVGNMKTDISGLKTDVTGLKADVIDIRSKMVTKDYLDERLHELENNVLVEVDRVQEKSNAHYAELKEEVRKVRIDMGTRDSEDIRAKLAIFERELAKVKEKVS